ncbi:hypothetical protein [Methylomonas sp. 11b]|uniref:hypothetical protein n=1 Tax=Methylomonas sp. 11b TaxID=1168169 RepID=UPI000478881B|nr:hypothetical protein [Methylomonas sp. 11b]
MIDPVDQLLDLIVECRHDPHKWSLVAWDWEFGDLKNFKGPRAWQSEINCTIRDHLSNPETRFEPLKISVASGHGIGKSAELGMLVNWALSTCMDTKVVVTANTLPQLKTKTIPEIKRWNALSITADLFDTNAFDIHSKAHELDWRCDFVTWSEHNTEAFAGLHNLGKRIVVIFDEASKIADKVWEVTEGALTDENTEIIWIAFGNPTLNSGAFRETHRKMRHRWVHKQIDSRDVEGTNKTQIQKWLEDWGEDSDPFKIRVRGMFPNMSAKQFISTEDVDVAFKRYVRPEQYSFAPIILTCDPAWEGDDVLVIALRQGLYSNILRVIPKNDNDVQIANILANLEDEHGADAVFIDGGYGTGIYSAGQTMGRDWLLVWFGAKSLDPGCLNKRAEMWKAMRDWLKAGGALPDDKELYDELMGPETVPRADGKIQLESKQDMKQRGLPSPNKADALALSFAHPVQKRFKNPHGRTKSAGEQRRDYDPYKSR